MVPSWCIRSNQQEKKQMANISSNNKSLRGISAAIRNNPTISNGELSKMDFGIAPSAVGPYATQARRELGIKWSPAEGKFVVPDELLKKAKKAKPAAIETPTVEIKVSPARPADKIKGLLEAAQKAYADAEAQRQSLLAQAAEIEKVSNAHLARIDELNTAANLPESVWKVISEIS